MSWSFATKKRRYTRPDRLSDVIRLISVLSMHKNAFKSEKGINDSLHGVPESVSSKQWKDLVLAHPEFFRLNDKETHFALVIRSYFPEDEDPKNPNEKLRGPLTVGETQTLIDFAVSLYDKEVDTHKISGIWVPVIVALIVLGGQVYNTLHANNAASDSNKMILTLKDSVQKLNIKIDRIAIHAKLSDH